MFIYNITLIEITDECYYDKGLVSTITLVVNLWLCRGDKEEVFMANLMLRLNII
jgi:hypothetical protein